MVPYLQIDGLTKSFGDLVLFNQISLGVAEGQRIGLIAKNGSGKTTLLNIIAGKEGYDEGMVSIPAVFSLSAKSAMSVAVLRMPVIVFLRYFCSCALSDSRAQIPA